ncbi:MAG TPA: benzoyl-CoA 2,3-epoxidase subunit BoxB [Candidatus Acidoferrales bacterium]|nr:benzoyl-CoA 2,3-epoxidase subunit BoxB [Candidatus Acidoferrales bacterium]
MLNDSDKIDYIDKIPNNVDLGRDKVLQRALEHWQPAYLNWWYDMGPTESNPFHVYLRTAMSVEPDGWAQFGYVRMPEYRWGIFLQPRDPDRQVNFGVHKGDPSWQEVPGEYRSTLRRIIVTQGDTEPASVEQQRMLGLSCPSLYDLRNIFQVNVEEGRHLWAMVYLLHRYFGRDGREEAEALLARRSGDADNPRILGAFNEPTPDWLAFFMFTFFTDRDGKFQLCALAESGFDPLARTCRFMLTEEAHHMFVGETGVARIIQRTCEVMAQNKIDDPADVRAMGVIDLQTLQKYLNFHYSVTLDLYGSDVSSNAANYYTNGLKGRFEETKLKDDHLLANDEYPVYEVVGDQIRAYKVPALTALNERLRDDYIREIESGLSRWNRVIEKAGLSFRLTLPHKGFHRAIGNFAGHKISPDGRVMTEAEWDKRHHEWLPAAADHAYVQSLMRGRVVEPGKFANWIAPPARGINSQPLNFEYVRFN